MNLRDLGVGFVFGLSGACGGILYARYPSASSVALALFIGLVCGVIGTLAFAIGCLQDK